MAKAKVEVEVTYMRKLSGEEALKRYILVLKDSLKLFPKPGTTFTIKIAGKRVDAELTLVDVWNQGGGKPSTEYHIDLSKHVDVFRPHFGQRITLVQKGEHLFELS